MAFGESFLQDTYLASKIVPSCQLGLKCRIQFILPAHRATCSLIMNWSIEDHVFESCPGPKKCLMWSLISCIGPTPKKKYGGVFYDSVRVCYVTLLLSRK